MYTYKTIERPAQVLGMNIEELGIMILVFLASILLLSFIGIAVRIPRLVYLVVLVVQVGMIAGLRYLSIKQAPGFLIAWLSFTFFQPRRVTVGLLPPAHAKAKTNQSRQL